MNSSFIPKWVSLLALSVPLLILILLPFSKLSEVGALIALIVFAFLVTSSQGRALLKERRYVLYFGLLFWVPALISCIDSVMPVYSMSRGFGYVRFIAILIVVGIIVSPQQVKTIGLVATGVLLFWFFDAFYEVITGSDWLDRPMYGSRINGPFDRPKLGYYAAPLTLLAAAWCYSKNRVFGLFMAVVGTATVLISGDRGGWLNLFWAVVIPSLIFLALKPSRIRHFIAPAFLGVALLSAAYVLHEPFERRVDLTMKIAFEDDGLTFDSRDGRAPLFDTATRMFQDNWINGVGIRAFRYAYFDYANSDLKHTSHKDVANNSENRTGQTHAHSNIFSLGAELGALGLLGYLGMLVAAFFYLYKHVKALDLFGTAVWAAPLGAVFPLNAHLALASSHWAIFIWLLFGIAFAWSKNGVTQK